MTTRKVEDIQDLLGLAKLNPSDFLSHSQTLYFAPSLNETEYSLFEMDEALVDSLTEGKVLTVKGEEGESAVVCTTSTTYELREAETSNCLLFLPHGRVLEKNTVENGSGTVSKCEVVATRNTYFELKLCRPKLNLVKKMLDESPYLGHIEEAESLERGEETQRYTLIDIMNRVQASKEEINVKIQELRGVEINDLICRLDIDYENQIVQSILDLIDEMSWERFKVPVGECAAKLAQLYPTKIIKQILRHYSKNSECDVSIASLNEAEICRQFGEHLLHHTTRFHLEEFLQLWQQLVPESIQPQLSYLRGIALVDRTSQPPSIWLFRRQDLDEDPATRFDQLFAKKSRWTLDEISQFLVDLCPEGSTAVTSLLAKFARASTFKGQRIYTSRAIKM